MIFRLLLVCLLLGVSALSRAASIEVNQTPLEQLKAEQGSVFIVMGQECPISRRMVPPLSELAEIAEDNKLGFYLVFSDYWATPESTVTFVDEYEIDFPVLLDSNTLLARELKPVAKPEAFVFNGQGELIYRGRIDNRFASIGRLRNHFDQHNLRDAMDALIKGENPLVAETQPIGCVYPPWE